MHSSLNPGLRNFVTWAHYLRSHAGRRLITDQFICNKASFYSSMLSIALVVLSFFTALILALVGRSKKTGIHTAWLALLIVVLNLIGSS